ncbi:MAG: ABC transporter permease [Ignavibacteria bacterium]|nr:ABC transporter permease [Ignavibacteria bacterium]
MNYIDKLLGNITLRIFNFLQMTGGIGYFTYKYFKTAFFPPYEIHEVRKHMDELGVRTLGLVSITGLIIGLVLGMQMQPVMARFGAEYFLPGVIALSVVRELGPVITALIFAGRVASGIGAELGSMRVTEQIDAMEVSAIDPFKYLVVTRVTACTLMLPLLTVYVNFIALFGGYISVTITQNLTLKLYSNLVISALEFSDILPTLAKTFVFGFIVGIVGSYLGYNADKGTEGVGKASTTSVVVSSLLILFFDVILVRITLYLFPQ